MRIAIDARELHGQPTGVGRFLTGLLDTWEVLPSAAAHEFVLCAPGAVDARRSVRVSTMDHDLKTHSPGRGSAARGGGTLWEQFTLPRLVRKAAADVFFAAGYTGPLLCPVPMVAAIYDVSFAARPDWFTAREGLRRRILTRLTARRAARVLTTSEFSRAEIVRRLRISPSKIDVVYPGANLGTAPGAAAGNEQIVLYVGSLFTRRHIPELIDGFARVARTRRDVRLEIVGDNRTSPRVDFERLVAASGAGDRIALRSYLPDEALTALYGRARAFVFLSEYEGFGMTPLEALAARVPIVVLDTPIAREVYGNAALYLPHPDPALVAAAIERVLSDGGERTRIVDAAERMLLRYSWQLCAEKVLNVLIACSRKSKVKSQRSKVRTTSGC